MAESKRGSLSKGLVWIILILLIVALAGFGATSFGGSLRSIGSVGDTEIPVDSYARTLEQQLRNLEQSTGQRITFSEAQAAGIDRSVLQQVISVAAIEDEADVLRLSVGDAAVRDEILRIPAFQGLDGQFDRAAYELALRRSNMDVDDFEQGIRDETARALLQGAVVGGVQTPAILTDTLFNFARETRDISIVFLGPDDLPGDLPAPGDAELRAFYEETPEPFTAPETRKITYAWLTPEMLIPETDVDEDALRAIYEERDAEFNQPERRLAERLVFADAPAAEAAAAAIAAGETSFDALVEERGLTLEDVDLGTVSAADLGSAAEPVFALTEPGIAGPVETGLGPALFRVNAILNARETPFEEVRDALSDEAAAIEARRSISDKIEPVEDLLAGGATIEEIAEETRFELGQIDWHDGLASFGGRSIDGYEEFRAAALAANPGDFPEVAQLSDGGLFMIRLDEIVPPVLRPFEEVRADVAARFDAKRSRDLLIERAEQIAAAQKEGETLEAQGFTPEARPAQLRDAFAEDLPQDAITTAFEMEPGEARAVAGPDGAVIVRLDAVNAADAQAEEAVQLRNAFAERTGQSYAQDIMTAYTRALELEKGITLQQSAISAVNAQFN
ncbi:peptidylprolyl isomerase [Profundibacterium mesophilum]|uniref:Peptidyl-prolyl cis-trans isomerase n=1 Tax=Profundibacterium mesophilum KAUST100406-0324 TaxID=1037889 RepID=A0A921NSP1_9RHOB|nr:peptidylprolyl isomerase [Profundibacterium mesophilum]KAF0674740.1 putative peptidyl-prolyl cis-trans isomerase [Profundibacterium mesophilum KAUST100406-0324]